MYWSSIANQIRRDPLFNASGTITSGGTAQLLLPEVPSRAYLVIQNISDTAMFVEFGSARAGAVTLASGVVTAIAVGNAGQGFTIPPTVMLLGGGNGGNPTYLGGAGPNFPAPSNASGSGGRPARARAVLTTGAVSSFVVEDGGAGYVTAPYVLCQNSHNDPFGVATPSATSGILLAANGGNVAFTSGFCPTDSVALFCATTGKAFICYYAP